VLGSIANLNVVEKAALRGVVIGFWDYFRVGAPLLLATRCGDTSAVVRHFLDLVKRTPWTLGVTVLTFGAAFDHFRGEGLIAIAP
jgi:hypothetical protein